jgi:phosphoribosyl 1,2-cyclic phosphodiesterase
MNSTGRAGGFAVTFHGVRGSTPCHAPELVRYGGNTSCVSLDIEGADPILFDLGTGLRYFGDSLEPGAPFAGTCLLSHLHWDHIQGLPFFAPLLQEGSDVTMYGPRQEGDSTLASVFADTICPPLFPVELAMLPGEIDFVECWESNFQLPAVNSCVDIMSRPIPHVGNTLGYRVTAHGRTVAYLSDHQMPTDGKPTMSTGARELCTGADLIIHDAQYTPSEFAQKSDWGHCTIQYAVWLAADAGAKRLALFHHDPSHDDDMLDRLAGDAVECGRELGVEVFAAREGHTIEV